MHESRIPGKIAALLLALLAACSGPAGRPANGWVATSTPAAGQPPASSFEDQDGDAVLDGEDADEAAGGDDGARWDFSADYWSDELGYERRGKKDEKEAQNRRERNARAQLLAGGADELWVIARAEAPRSDGEAAPGSVKLLARPEGSQETIALPLRHTDVKARILGYIASVDVVQSYDNPYAGKIEAVYVFPLPETAAVSDFVMTIGDRRIRGIVRDRAEAEQIYREARREGYVASLLTQERPNVFTQKVANIEPGKRIDVQLTYFDALPYRDGGYVFSFPMVVGPRFNPPGTRDGVGAVARGATGASGQATEVSYLAPGDGSAHRLSLTVELDAGVPLAAVDSPTHAIEADAPSPSRRRVTLARGKVVPDKDFVLRYRVAGERIQHAFFASRDASGDGGTFAFVLQPPASLADVRRAPLELVFVLDCSGSMSGVPLAKAKRAARAVLERLTPSDTFQIIRFSESASALGRAPVPATAANVARGLRYLESLDSQGGTMMIEGVKAALDFPHAPARLRLVTFMTDGYIGNEAEILAAIHRKLGASRIFSFGVGSSVNRFLIEGMARAGRGAVAYVGLEDDAADREVDAFYRRIAHPALADIQVAFPGMTVTEVYPRRIPDLFVGRPVVVTGRFRGPLGRKIQVSGRVAGRPAALELPIEADAVRAHPALTKIWARMKIADLGERALLEDDVAPLAASIKEVALTHGLLSAYTAFVAVDSSRRTEGEHGTTVAVPVPVPEGVRYDTTVR